MDFIIQMAVAAYAWLSDLLSQIADWGRAPASGWGLFLVVYILWRAAKQILHEIARLKEGIDRIEYKLKNTFDVDRTHGPF
jgi:hypothetical protein